MRVKRVDNYFYRKHDSVVVFNGRDVDYYLSRGYKRVDDYSGENHYRLTRPAEVWLDIIDENGNQHSVECKDTIVAAYGKKKISPKMAKRFFTEFQYGKWYLELDHWGKLIAFPR